MIYKPVFCHIFQEITTRVTERFGQLMVGFRLVLIATKSTYKLRHVCPSAHMYERGSHWTDFCEIWYWALLWKSVEKIQIGLKSERNIRHCCVSMATPSVCVVLIAVHVRQQYRGSHCCAFIATGYTNMTQCFALCMPCLSCYCPYLAYFQRGFLSNVFIIVRENVDVLHWNGRWLVLTALTIRYKFKCTSVYTRWVKCTNQ